MAFCGSFFSRTSSAKTADGVFNRRQGLPPILTRTISVAKAYTRYSKYCTEHW